MCQQKANSWKVAYGYGRCLKCGDRDLDNLTWHHRDKSTKLKNPSKWTTKIWALEPSRLEWQVDRWNRTRAEVRKCDLLCRHCHQALHYAEQKRENRMVLQTILFWKVINHEI